MRRDAGIFRLSDHHAGTKCGRLPHSDDTQAGRLRTNRLAREYKNMMCAGDLSAHFDLRAKGRVVGTRQLIGSAVLCNEKNSPANGGAKVHTGSAGFHILRLEGSVRTIWQGRKSGSNVKAFLQTQRMAAVRRGSHKSGLRSFAPWKKEKKGLWKQSHDKPFSARYNRCRKWLVPILEEIEHESRNLLPPIRGRSEQAGRN